MNWKVIGISPDELQEANLHFHFKFFFFANLHFQVMSQEVLYPGGKVILEGYFATWEFFTWATGLIHRVGHLLECVLSHSRKSNALLGSTR